MEIKLEGRHVELGAELQERINKRLDSFDQRFGPITHARVTVERKARKNEQRATAKLVINIAGATLTVSKEAPNVVAAVNEALDAIHHELKTHVDKKRKSNKRGAKTIRTEVPADVAE